MIVIKSVKPGRGPSMIGGIMGIFGVIFGVFWTVMAASSGGGFMIPFGIMFIIAALISTVYNFKNATGEKRYSAFDIVDGSEEADPLNLRYGNKKYNGSGFGQGTRSSFCPYCGNKVSEDFEYCNKCGKKLP